MSLLIALIVGKIFSLAALNLPPCMFHFLVPKVTLKSPASLDSDSNIT